VAELTAGQHGVFNCLVFWYVARVFILEIRLAKY